MAVRQRLASWGGARTIDATVVRQTFREVVDEATGGGRRIVITRHGRPVAALIPMRDFERLQEKDAETDRRMLARRSATGGTVDFEEFATAALSGGGKGHDAGKAESIGVEQLADEVAGDFMVDFLGPQVTAQAKSQILTMIQERVGDATSVTPAEAVEIRRAVIELLWSSVVQVPA
jgi:prevent-host-death family protein